jgi:large subunit ribosomal protein L10
MARADKEAAVAGLTEQLRNSTGAVLADYRGLSVAQMAELRRALAGHATFRIVKNTLTKLAVKDAGLEEELSSFLTGPSAIAFVDGDVVEAAKGLRTFGNANPALEIKGGVVDGRPVTPADIRALADLESREVLLAKLAGAMKASLSNAAALFNALPTEMAQLTEALRVKREESGEAAPAGSGEAAPAESGEDSAAESGESNAAESGEDAAAETGDDAPAEPAEA